MGVQGLQTFLRDHRRQLSKTHKLPGTLDSPKFVVDGWSFIYNIQFTSGISWVYGGEYEQFYHLVQSVVNAWLQIGCRLHFVFDGPYPQLKFNTSISRLSESAVHPGQLFFRSSPSSRSQPRFLNEHRILPPLSFVACISALESLNKDGRSLEIHYADEEGDPFAVELAGRIGGFVVGTDSDFVILNHEGYKGYVPLEEMLWSSVAVVSPQADEDGDFQQVQRGKRKQTSAQATIGRGIIPPSSLPADLALSFTVYAPSQLSTHLGLPQSLLPLLGALIGNDYTHNLSMRLNPQKLFFDPRSNATQRFSHVSQTIQNILSSSQRRKGPKPLNSVIDLIELTVNDLLSRVTATFASGEIEQVVDKIVESTLKYAIGASPSDPTLWPTEVCALHTPDTCKLLPIISRAVEEEAIRQQQPSEEGSPLSDKEIIRARYLAAYRAGSFSPRLMDIFNTGTFWPRLFLENPDLETVSVTFGRHLRQWCYAILEDALGLPDNADESATPTSDENADSDDELVDVVSDSDSDSEVTDSEALASPPEVIRPGEDPLQSLTGALQLLNSKDAGHLPRNIVVVENVRRGTRIASEEVSVPALEEILPPYLPQGAGDMSPLMLSSDDNRRIVFLRILKSDMGNILSIPSESLLTVLAIRWVIITLGERAKDSGSWDRQKERWTRRELRCFLASATPSADLSELEGVQPEPNDRNIQLVTQFLAATEAVHCLSQVLLMSKAAPPCIHQFSGKRCHAYLTGSLHLPWNDHLETLLKAAEEGIDVYFVEDIQKKKKKTKSSSARSNATGPSKAPLARGVGLFSMLDSVDA